MKRLLLRVIERIPQVDDWEHQVEEGNSLKETHK